MISLSKEWILQNWTTVVSALVITLMTIASLQMRFVLTLLWPRIAVFRDYISYLFKSCILVGLCLALDKILFTWEVLILSLVPEISSIVKVLFPMVYCWEGVVIAGGFILRVVKSFKLKLKKHKRLRQDVKYE